MKKLLLISLFISVISCTPEKSGPILMDAKMYLNGDTFVYPAHYFIYNSTGPTGLMVYLYSDTTNNPWPPFPYTYTPSLAIDVYAHQTGTYQIKQGNESGYASFSCLWEPSLFDGSNISVANDSNTVTIDHLTQFKTSGTFHTYISVKQDTTITGPYLATGYFNFEAQ